MSVISRVSTSFFGSRNNTQEPKSTPAHNNSPDYSGSSSDTDNVNQQPVGNSSGSQSASNSGNGSASNKSHPASSVRSDNTNGQLRGNKAASGERSQTDANVKTDDAARDTQPADSDTNRAERVRSDQILNLSLGASAISSGILINLIEIDSGTVIREKSERAASDLVLSAYYDN